VKKFLKGREKKEPTESSLVGGGKKTHGRECKKDE